jgi:hypothetical protein
VNTVAAAGDVPVSPISLDRIVISSILFDDLSVEGDAAVGAQQHVLEIGRLVQLRRVLGLWQSGLPRNVQRSIAVLRERVALLAIAAEPEALQSARRLAGAYLADADIEPILRVGLQNVKDLGMDDLRKLDADSAEGSEPGVDRLRALHASYTEWLTRLEAAD